MRDIGIDRAVVGRGNDEEATDEVGAREGALDDAYVEPAQLVIDLGSDHSHAGEALEQSLRLLGRNPPAADDEAIAPAQVEAGHVVPRFAHVPTLVNRAPCASRRTDRS